MSSARRAKRQSFPLTGRIEKQLGDYLLAASSAGVGILALAQPAEAKIVYTPTSQFVQNGFLNIDLNNDGQVDFTIEADSSTLTGGKLLLAFGDNLESDGVAWAKWRSPRYGFALKFNSGSSIGGKVNPKINFGQSEPLMSSYEGVRGFWLNSRGYLGLRIKIDKEWHYGWARLRVRKASALLTAYAYETIANKPIKAGQTRGDSESGAQLHSYASLGALALGSQGLPLWRREEPALEMPAA